MHDIDVGPVRRLPRAKRKSTDVSDGQNSVIKHKTTEASKGKRKSNDKDDWFSNSFDFQPRTQKTRRSPSHDNKHVPSCHSTPKAKRRRKSSLVTGLDDSSDALLADFDIDTIVETASQSQPLRQPSNSQSQDLTEEAENQKQANKSACTQEDSQYFPAKFAKYHATQPRSASHKHHEVIVQNKLTQQKPAKASDIKKSVCNGKRTQSAKSDMNESLSLVDKEFSTTQVLSDASNSQVFDSEKWNSGEPVSSTQVGKPYLTKSISRSRQRCTPYSTGTADFTKTDETLSGTQVSHNDSVVVDTTILKDNSSRIAKACTPYKIKNKHDNQKYSQSQSVNGDTQLDITQLKDEVSENNKYRCTPYSKEAKYISTQSSTQAELVAGTQYSTRLDNSCTVNTQGTQMGMRVVGGTQYPTTQMCYMTGVIVDSQDNGEDKGGNTSDCDIFSESFHEEVQPVTQKGHSLTGRPCDEEVTSHTQTLVANADVGRQNVKKENIDCSQPVIGVVVENKIGKDSMCVNKVNSSAIHTKSVNISNVGTSSNASKILAQSGVSTELGTRDTVTPGRPGSLQDKIKQRLKENVGQRTPKGPGSLVEQLREQVLERVQLESERQTDTEDIGPFYGLPSKVQLLFEKYRGIKKFYDWQDECLRLPAVAERRNLIYSLPTSGGKTLVAEILILKSLLCLKQDALFILPFVSIVQEKVRNMSEFAVDLSFHVEEYAGSKGRYPPLKRRKNRSLYIATIEKAHSIINSLTETNRMDSLGLVVVDELHMLGEGGSRGATLESTIMKILQAGESTQVIGMSATLSNMADLQKFLKAEVYTNNFRPVKLTECVKLTDSIYSVDEKAVGTEDQFTHDRFIDFQYLPEMEKLDPDHLLGLVVEVIPDNSCLVFCPTKKNCENVAAMLSKMMKKYKRELHEVKKQERHNLLKELYHDSEGKVCPTLRLTIPWGMAYHHSGLTMDERKLIEDAYSSGILCLLACTSTLAAGVNLPAKRVILRSPYIGQYFISRTQYKQMVGRAGRAGIDTSGESILICKASDRTKVSELLAGPIEKCHSSLVYDGGKGIRTLLLSTIGLKITCTTEAVFRFITRSLCHIQQSSLQVDVTQLCRDALQGLIDNGLVLQTKAHNEDPVSGEQQHSLEVTELGLATFKGPIDPDYACRLYKDLKQAEEPLVISTHLHLLYLVTPYDTVTDVQPSWFTYFNQISALSPSEQKVANLIGVPEAYVGRLASQQKSKMKVDEFVVKRFYLTLMLYDLWKQKSIWEVSDKYQQPRGFIQNLLSSAASFASCVSHFCQQLKEFWAYQDLMGNFVKQLAYCVTAELIPLMEIPGVKLGRARLMFAAGYKTLGAVAGAQTDDLVKAIKFLSRKDAQQIIASAKLVLAEKAEAMMEEMEQLVTIPANIAADTVTMATDMTTPAALLQTPSLSQLSSDSQVIEHVVPEKV